MGVINVTPDSFVDEVRTPTTQAAVLRCLELIAEGAHVIDIGGESTRPGAAEVSTEEELGRVIPVIDALMPSLSGHVTISIDTRNEAVARAAVASGAGIINDMSSSLGAIAGELEVGYVAAHMQGTPDTMQAAPRYDNVVDEVLARLLTTARAAADAGAPTVWIDPGLGFGKTDDHNLDLVAHIDRFVASGFPVLVGMSRKTTVGRLHAASDAGIALGQVEAPAPTDDRLEGSLAVVAWCAALGVDMARVHDVSETIQALGVAAARDSA